MKFQTHNDGYRQEVPTCMRGTLQATMAQLAFAFGDPEDAYTAGADDVYWTWRIKFEDGQVATIYDFRQVCRPFPTQIVAWHIGGELNKPSPHLIVHEIFRAAMERLQLAKKNEARNQTRRRA